MQRKSSPPSFMWTFKLSISSRNRESVAGYAERKGRVPLVNLFFSFALITGLVGCGSSTSSTRRPIRIFEGRTVRISCPDNPCASVVHRYSQPWSLQTGARVEVLQYDPGTGPEKGPAAEIWVIPPARMPHWAAAGKLHEVPETVTADGAPFAWERILRAYEKLLTWDRKAFALPLLGDELLCFYREDLFQDPHHRAEFRKSHATDLPEPGRGPHTWQEFAEVAEYFNKQRKDDSDRSAPSLPPIPSNDDDLDREFYSVVVPFAQRGIRVDERKPPQDNEMLSFHYDLETGNARISTPGFVVGLEMLKRLQACRPPREALEPAVSFRKGEAVLCLAGPSWISRFVNETGLQGKWGICRPPGSQVVFEYQSGIERAVPEGNYVPYLGARGWVAVVPRSNATPDAAFALTAMLGDPQTSREIVIEPEWGGGIFRREHLESKAGWQAFGLGDRTESFVEILREIVVHPQLKNSVTRLRIPDEREHQLAVLEEVREVLLRGKEPAKALQDAARRWQAIDQKKDAKLRRLEYRLSLGLSF